MRILLTSLFKISIPLKMVIFRIKKSQNSYLSIETSMLTPFCIFLDVSAVKNNSTILQFGNLVSVKQSYSRKLIISKSRIALKPLKTLLQGSGIQSLLLMAQNSNCGVHPHESCGSRCLRQLCKFVSLILDNQMFCQLKI